MKGRAFQLVMGLTLSFTLRDFSFPFDLMQFMKNRTHVFLINCYKITEMLTFLKSHFIWRLLLDSFKAFKFGEEVGHPATFNFPSNKKKQRCDKDWPWWGGVSGRPHFTSLPPWLPVVLGIKSGLLSLAFKASTPAL